MFGKNPIRPPAKGGGDILDVQRIFPTMQGEGPFAGTPAVFVRLGGCNLACAFCDTEFEDFRPMPVADVVAQVRALAGQNTAYPHATKLVVVSGGEPLRQPITPLCEALLAAGFHVQVETNGTLYRELPREVHIVCSPKNTSGSYAPLRGDVLARAAAIKFIVSATAQGYNDVAEVGQSDYGTPVYVQPMDEYDETRNAENLRYAAELAAERGYKLSLQTHKFIGVE